MQPSDTNLDKHCTPGVDVPVGEYVDITLSWSKAQDVRRSLGTKKRRLRLVWMPLIAGLFIVPLLAAIAIESTRMLGRPATWTDVVFTVVPLIIVGAAIAGVFWLYMFADECGEPGARVRRVYAGCGRVDIVVFGFIARSFTRENATLTRKGTLAKGARPRDHTHQLRRSRWRVAYLRLTDHDGLILDQLWNQPTIAPPYGSTGE